MTPSEALATAFADADTLGVRACVLVIVHDDGTTTQYFHAAESAVTLLGSLAVVQRDILTLVPPIQDAPDA